VKEEEEEEKSPSSPASRAIPAQQRQSIEENRIWLSLLFFARSPATAVCCWSCPSLYTIASTAHTHTPRSLISILFLFYLLCVGNRVGSRAIAVQQHPQLRPFCRFFLSLASPLLPHHSYAARNKKTSGRGIIKISRTLLLTGSSVFIWHQKKKKKSIHWDLSAGNHLDKGKED
jgi:hypothetical protein